MLVHSALLGPTYHKSCFACNTVSCCSMVRIGHWNYSCFLRCPYGPLSLQETRKSFVKMSAGRRGYRGVYVPKHEIAVAPPVATLIAPHPGDEEKSRQASSSADASDAKLAAVAERSHPMALASSLLPESVSVSSRQQSPRRFVIAGLGVPQAESASPGTVDVAKLGEGVQGAYSDSSCSVCLDDYEEGDQLLQLTCGHVFHGPCIDLWLKSHRECPCCRWAIKRVLSAIATTVVPLRRCASFLGFGSPDRARFATEIRVLTVSFTRAIFCDVTHAR